ncbi:hypothetical protein D3C79_661130 [compost metagenome]
MVTRRTESIQWRNASNGRSALLRRSSQGSSMSLETMVDSATASTMTMPVAAEAPPMNASRARLGCASASGRLMTNESEITVPGSSICPARAIGTTNSAASARYIGNTQRARRMSWGSMFSTTVTWNCRGRQMIAIIATAVCTTIDGQLMVSCQ